MTGLTLVTRRARIGNERRVGHFGRCGGAFNSLGISPSITLQPIALGLGQRGLGVFQYG